MCSSATIPVSTVFSLGYDFLIRHSQKSKPKKTTEQQISSREAILPVGAPCFRTENTDTGRQDISPCLMFTIQQLIDEDKVVLDVFLADLAKVGGHDITHLVEELKHHSGIDILLGDGSQPDGGAFDVEEAGPGDVGDRRADLLPGMDDIHSECVHCIPPGQR